LVSEGAILLIAPQFTSYASIWIPADPVQSDPQEYQGLGYRVSSMQLSSTQTWSDNRQVHYGSGVNGHPQVCLTNYHCNRNSGLPHRNETRIDIESGPGRAEAALRPDGPDGGVCHAVCGVAKECPGPPSPVWSTLFQSGSCNANSQLLEFWVMTRSTRPGSGC